MKIFVQVEVGDGALARWVLEWWGKPEWQAVRVSDNGSLMTPLQDDAPIDEGDVIGFISRQEATSRAHSPEDSQPVRRTIGELDGTFIVESA